MFKPIFVQEQTNGAVLWNPKACENSGQCTYHSVHLYQELIQQEDGLWVYHVHVQTCDDDVPFRKDADDNNDYHTEDDNHKLAPLEQEDLGVRNREFDDHDHNQWAELLHG